MTNQNFYENDDEYEEEDEEAERTSVSLTVNGEPYNPLPYSDAFMQLLTALVNYSTETSIARRKR